MIGSGIRRRPAIGVTMVGILNNDIDPSYRMEEERILLLLHVEVCAQQMNCRVNKQHAGTFDCDDRGHSGSCCC